MNKLQTKRLSPSRIYDLIKNFLGKDFLLAGIGNIMELTFYFGSKDSYKKVLSKRDSFLQLGYVMKAPQYNISVKNDCVVQYRNNQEDFKEITKKNDENKETKPIRSFKVTFE